MKNIFFKRGQSLTEIALIITVVSLVFIGMGVYFKRGINGKIKDLTDNLIGKKQAVYQQDTSGLEINKSNTISTFTSETTLEEKSAGLKSLKSEESSTVEYSSETEDSLQ